MNSRAVFVCVLIALNGAAWYFFARAKTAMPQASAHPPAATNLLPAEKPRPAPVVVVRTNAFTWEQLESEDYRTYIGRLRKIGCPEETIRDIVIADVEKLFAAQVQSIDGPREAPKYWQPRQQELALTIKSLQKKYQKLDVDFAKREIVRELLGVDLAEERSRARGETDAMEQTLGFLPLEKRSKARMLAERAAQEEASLREQSLLENDALTPAERAKLREIQARKDREIAALLSPEEQQQYDLWHSASAERVREGFLTLEASEPDFLALYQLQREFDQRWPDAEEVPPAQRAQFDAARAEFEGQVKDYLGGERYAEYQRAQDPDFRQIHAAAEQFGLEPARSAEIYGFKQVLRGERARLRASPDVPSAQLDELLHALNLEAERSIIEVMGPKAFRYYVRQGGGQWIWD